MPPGSDTSYAGQGTWDYTSGAGQFTPGATRNPVNDPYMSGMMPGANPNPYMQAWPSYLAQPPPGSGVANTPSGTPDYSVSDDAAARTWAAQQIRNNLFTEAGPDFAKNQIARDNAGFKIGQLNIQDAQEAGYLNKGFDISNRKLDLRSKGVDLAKQGNDIDIAANARQPGYLTALHNIAGQGFDLSRQQNLAQGRQNQFNQFNQSVAQGNVLTGGYGVQRGELAQQLGRAQRGTDLSQQEETTKFGENMAQTDDQRRRLQLQDQQVSLDAQNVGLDKEDLQNQLNQGLERLHLNTSMSIRDLYDGIQSSNMDTAIMYRNIWNQAWQASDGSMKSLYPGMPTPSQYAGDPTSYAYSLPREHMAGL